MADAQVAVTQYGFTFGAAEVERCADFDGRVCIGIKTATRELHIDVSPKGRSIRVFENGKELKAYPEGLIKGLIEAAQGKAVPAAVVAADLDARKKAATA